MSLAEKCVFLVDVGFSYGDLIDHMKANKFADIRITVEDLIDNHFGVN